MVGLPEGEKTLRIMYNRLDSIPACDNGWTDRQTDVLRRHNPRYAYASRGKNFELDVFSLLSQCHLHNVPLFLIDHVCNFITSAKAEFMRSRRFVCLSF